MGGGIAKNIVLALMALALGAALGTITKFGLGYDLAAAVETSSTSIVATR
jgi:hypothetical protein